jgi:AraC-like DNA-binding protein
MAGQRQVLLDSMSQYFDRGLAGTAAMSADYSAFGIVSTDNIKVSDRREFWEASAVPLFGRLQLEAHTSQPFAASFAYANLADLVLCRLSASVPHRVVRTDAVARHDNRAYVKAVFQAKGSSVVEQCGRRAVLQPGEWSIYDATRSYSVDIPDRAELYILMIPHDRILRGNFDLHKVMLRRLSGHRGLGKLVWSLVSATFDQIQGIENRSCHDVADLVVQMTRLALVDSAEDGALVHSNEALRCRVKSYISGHLDDPDLSIAKLARLTGCTKRYLHMVFQPEEMSISNYIRKLRLEHCREDLLDPACAHRSITDIAYSWGFNNSNHFSRCFRLEFGASPRDSRTGFVRRPLESRRSA